MNDFCGKQLLNFFFYPLVVFHCYGVESEVQISIVMLVKGVVPIEVSSLANCNSYSCNNSFKVILYSCREFMVCWVKRVRCNSFRHHFSSMSHYLFDVVSCWSVESKTAGSRCPMYSPLCNMRCLLV